MATIVTRSGKGSALTHTEMDANFDNLNTDKAELSGATFTGAIVLNSGAGADLGIDEAGLYYNTANLELLAIENDGVGDVTVQVDAFTSSLPTTTGTEPTYVATYGITALVTGRVYEVKIHSTNTGAATINLDGIGAKPIVDKENIALIGSELVANVMATLLYDGTSFRLQNESAVDTYIARNKLDFDSLAPIHMYLGTADLGSVTMTTNTTLDSGEYHYSDLTLNGSQVLDITEASDGFLIIRATGTVTISGTIDLDGKGSVGGASVSGDGEKGNTGGAATGGGTGGAGGSSNTGDGGDGSPSIFRGVTISGPAGPTANNTNGTAGSSMDAQHLRSLNYIIDPINYTGGGGGSGGTPSIGVPSGVGGDGGGCLIIVADTIDFQTGAVITLDGTDGTVDNNAAGGGGGGSGGTLILVSQSLTNDGTITSTGGSGGVPTTGGNGGAGGDGTTLIITL